MNTKLVSFHNSSAIWSSQIRTWFPTCCTLISRHSCYNTHSKHYITQVPDKTKFHNTELELYFSVPCTGQSYPHQPSLKPNTSDKDSSDIRHVKCLQCRIGHWVHRGVGPRRGTGRHSWTETGGTFTPTNDRPHLTTHLKRCEESDSNCIAIMLCARDAFLKHEWSKIRAN